MHLDPQVRLRRPRASRELSRQNTGKSDSSEDSEVQMLNKIQVRFSAGIPDGLVKLE